MTRKPLPRRSLAAPALYLLLAAGLCGCATVMTGDRQTLQIASQPAGARLTLTDSQGQRLFDGITPARVDVTRGGGGWRRHPEYRIRLEKPGHRPVDVALQWKREPWFWGNWLFAPVGLGFVGLLIVDPSTGAMWRIEPEQLTIPLAPDR